MTISVPCLGLEGLGGDDIVVAVVQQVLSLDIGISIKAMACEIEELSCILHSLTVRNSKVTQCK